MLHEVARLDSSYLNKMFQVDFPPSVNNILEVKALMYAVKQMKFFQNVKARTPQEAQPNKSA